MRSILLQAILAFLALPATNGATNAVVVHALDPQAVTGLRVDAVRAASLLRHSLFTLTGTTDERAAWRTFVGTNDIVGIKITAEPGPLLASHRPLVEAIVTGLRNAGIPATKIHVFDRDPTKLHDAGFDGLAKPIIGGAGWDVENFYEQNLVGKLIWGDLLFRQTDDDLSTRSHLPRFLTRQCTKLINLAVLRDYDATGIAGCLHNISLGMVDNTRRFELAGPATDRAVAEIGALPSVRNKTVLHILDALVGGYAGNGTLKTRYSWPYASLYLSTDPVALDTLALELIEPKRKEVGLPPAGERARHIAAAARLGLGEADREKIRVISGHSREDQQK